jgi:DNA gyrase subunit A
MAEIARELLHVNLEDEMRQSYLDYAMSVIVAARYQMCGTA